MLFCFEGADDYMGKHYYFCPEKEMEVVVDIDPAYNDDSGDWDEDEIIKLTDEKFRETFGDDFGKSVFWKW